MGLSFWKHLLVALRRKVATAMLNDAKHAKQHTTIRNDSNTAANQRYDNSRIQTGQAVHPRERSRTLVPSHPPSETPP